MSDASGRSPTRYFPEASSASFFASVAYGLRTLSVLFWFTLNKRGLRRSRRFDLTRSLASVARPLLQERLVHLHTEPGAVERQDRAVGVLHGPAHHVAREE